jgi:transposase-like protein
MAVTEGLLLYTDEYDIYDRLPVWGHQHLSICHSKGEYARDADGDGFQEIHVNTMKGFWSLLRSWLRPHRGISQEKLPIYLRVLPVCSQCAQKEQTAPRRARWYSGRQATTPKSRMSLAPTADLAPAIGATVNPSCRSSALDE